MMNSSYYTGPEETGTAGISRRCGQVGRQTTPESAPGSRTARLGCLCHSAGSQKHNSSGLCCEIQVLDKTPPSKLSQSTFRPV